MQYTYLYPGHPRWGEFADKIEGPEGCNFRPHPHPTKRRRYTWTCDSSPDRPITRRILHGMGFDPTFIQNTMIFLHGHGGYCDCEVVMNVVQEYPSQREARQ